VQPLISVKETAGEDFGNLAMQYLKIFPLNHVVSLERERMSVGHDAETHFPNLVKKKT
jgi:hypothetical protein